VQGLGGGGSNAQRGDSARAIYMEVNENARTLISCVQPIFILVLQVFSQELLISSNIYYLEKAYMIQK
jgi:hypothetical protein